VGEETQKSGKKLPDQNSGSSRLQSLEFSGKKAIAAASEQSAHH